ncbi:MAG: hypothetical protein AAFP19_09635 [Bacteroidota bacterium]
MKNAIIFIAAMTLAFSTWAQQEETLFGKARVVGAFGAPIVEFGQFGDNDEIGTSVGGGGGLIIGNFFLGGYGLGTTELAEEIFDDDNNFRLDMGHGGLWFGFTSPHYKLLHFFSSAKIGWGAIGIEIDENNASYDDGIFVLTPEAGVELNVFRWFKIATTVGYRYVDGIRANDDIASDALNGMVATLTFRIGGFGHWHRNNW